MACYGLVHGFATPADSPRVRCGIGESGNLGFISAIWADSGRFTLAWTAGLLSRATRVRILTSSNGSVERVLGWDGRIARTMLISISLNLKFESFSSQHPRKINMNMIYGAFSYSNCNTSGLQLYIG